MSRRRPRPSRLAPNPSGVHLLPPPTVLRELVATTAPGSLVVDLGAGPGTITAALAARGARVLAIERDPRFAAILRRRFADQPRVRVVEADLRRARLPARARVVANPPFAVSTLLLRRLLGGSGPPHPGADLLVEHGFARRATAAAGVESAWWAARHELRLLRPVAPSAFAPPPRVAAALLRIRPRPPLPPVEERALRALVVLAHGRPRSARAVAVQVLGARRGPRTLRALGVDGGAPARTVPVSAWRAAVRPVAGAAPRRR